MALTTSLPHSIVSNHPSMAHNTALSSPSLKIGGKSYVIKNLTEYKGYGSAAETTKYKDLSAYSQAQLTNLTSLFEKMINRQKTLTATLKNSHIVILRFEEYPEDPIGVLQRIFQKFHKTRLPSPEISLKEIAYQSRDSQDEIKTLKLQDFGISLSEPSSPFQKILSYSHNTFENRPTAFDLSLMRNMIKDTGSRHNLCAPLSVASQLLARVRQDQDYEEIITKFGLNLGDRLVKNKGNLTIQRVILARALKQKAINNILQNEEFLRIKNGDSNTPSFNCIVQAYEAANLNPNTSDLNINDRNVRVEIRRKYVEHMQGNNMLDQPFFVALGKPFIVISPRDGKMLGLNMISAGLDVQNLTVEQIRETLIVYYNGHNHYQTFIVPPDQEIEFCNILKKLPN